MEIISKSYLLLLRNAQGDIIGLIDGSENEVVSYTYDTWGRFINADEIIGIAGALTSHNLFAYCMGDPIKETDSTEKNYI